MISALISAHCTVLGTEPILCFCSIDRHERDARRETSRGQWQTRPPRLTRLYRRHRRHRRVSTSTGADAVRNELFLSGSEPLVALRRLIGKPSQPRLCWATI